jgi:VWFA-related protein
MALRGACSTGGAVRTRPITVALAIALGVALGAQQAPAPSQEDQPLPRFRAGANLVRVDAYVSANGQALTDLTADDFEVLEDDTPQKIENFELVRPRDTSAETTSAAPVPNSTRDQRAAAQDPNARLFVLFLDRFHVSLDGSARSAAPVEAFLDKVVGPNDLVGVMTPDITPQNITLVRKGTGVDRVLRDFWYWGERDKLNSPDQHEEDLKACYPDSGQTAGIATEMIERRREQQALRAIDSLVGYLDGIREERKFVLLFSEGWVQFRRNDQLGRPLGGRTPGGLEPAGVGSDGRLTTAGRQAEGGGYDACERERVMLSYIDHELEVRQMAQRANRANVSFYPLDPRGLVAFDANPVATRRFDPNQDRTRLASRQDGLKLLAEQTDGAWVLNTNDTAGAITRILADTSSYYLLSYYSSNAKLDGRFRRITVRVKRENSEVRHRMGYLAPTESEARAAGAAIGRVTGTLGLKTSVSPAVSKALESIAPGKGNVSLRVQATGLPTKIRTFIELDPVTAKQPEWQMGGTLQITIESDRGGAPAVISAALPAGQRSVVVEGPNAELPPGRYYVRVEGRAERGSATIRAATDATVGASGAAIGSALVVYRRGPTTGLAFQPTADPRFRRTERIRAEVPILTDGAVTGAGRVLTREGQPLPLQVTMSERADERNAARYLIGEVALAPLAQGDFILEIKAGTQAVSYGFRIVP